MIRSRLLFKLGIYDSNFTNASMHHKHHKVQHCNSKKEEQPQQQQSQQPLSPVQSSSQEESQDTVRGSDITITYLVPLKIDQDPQEEQASSPHLILDRPSSSSLLASSSLNLQPPPKNPALDYKSVDPASSNSTHPQPSSPSPRIDPTPPMYTLKSTFPRRNWLTTQRETHANSSTRDGIGEM